MLVLSRRPGEKILLPTLSVLIKVISSQSGLTRLGVDAPSRVPILREELCAAEAVPAGSRSAGDRSSRDLLNSLSRGLALLRLQLAEGGRAARQLLDALEEDLHGLSRQLAPDDDDPYDPELALVGGAGV